MGEWSWLGSFFQEGTPPPSKEGLGVCAGGVEGVLWVFGGLGECLFFERGFWGYRVSEFGFGVQALGVSGDLRASKIRNARFLAGLRFQV